MQIRKHIPNAITSMNLFSGTLGVVCALSGSMGTAFVLMLAAAVFDFFDGFAARKLGAYSDIGKELDSLADMVSFGVLPAIMLSVTMHKCISQAHGFVPCGTVLDIPPHPESWAFWMVIATCIPLILAVFSGLRLAKFNIDERQHGSFIGLPTPACAMICGSVAICAVTGRVSWLASLCGTWWFVPVLTVVLCALLVCEIPMFAMKFGKGIEADYPTRVKRIAFLAGSVCIFIAVAVTGGFWALIVLGVFLYYLIINLTFAAAGVFKSGHKS